MALSNGKKAVDTALNTGSNIALTEAYTTVQVSNAKALNLVTTAEQAKTVADEGMVVAQKTATASTFTFSGALTSLKTSLMGLAAAHPILTTIALVGGAFVGISAIIDASTTSLEEQQEVYDNAKKEYAEVKNELTALNSELSTNKDRITELQKLSKEGTISLVETDELKNLKDANAELERQIALKSKIANDKQQIEIEESYKLYQKENSSLDGIETPYDSAFENGRFQSGSFEMSVGDGASSLRFYDYAIEENKKNIENYKKEIQSLNEDLVNTQDDYEKELIQNDINNKESILNSIVKGNEDLTTRAQTIVQNSDSEINDKLTSLEEFRNELLEVRNIDGSFDDENYQKMWDDIVAQEKAIYKFGGNSGEWNELELSATIDTATLEKSLRQIRETKGEDGIITSEDVNNCKSLQDALNEANLSLEDGEDSAEIIAKYLNKARESAEIISETNWDDPTAEFTDTTDKTNTSTLADLSSEADLLKTINQELTEDGKISATSLGNMIKQYPEAKKALSDYLQGIITQQELFQELQNVYDADKESYINDIVAKSETDADFWNAVYGGSVDVQNSLATIYGQDFEGFKTLAQAKQKLDDTLMSNLKANWGEYLAYVAKAADGTYSLMTQIQAEENYVDNAIGGDAANAEMADQINSEFSKFSSSRTEELKNFINNINSAINDINNASYNKVSSSLDLSWQGLGKDPSGSSGSDSQTSEQLDWIERLIKKVTKAFDRLQKVSNNTYKNWSTRNNGLIQSMSALTDEINVQSSAYSWYMNNFNGYGLDSHYKDLIMNGGISVETITDSNLKDAIKDCIDLYDKAQDCLDTVTDLNQQMSELAKQKFDNISTQFEDLTGLIEHSINTIQSNLDMAESQGYFASQKYYEALIETEQNNVDKLRQERTALQNSLSEGISTGAIEQYSEAWYEMNSSINSVSESIQDATASLVEYENAMRQLEWDMYDYGEERINQLTSENDFLIGLMSHKTLTDEDTGELTSEGTATVGLHASNYDIYMEQADAYAKEYQRIQEELAKDPYNKELIERREELLGLQQESINSALDEKDAIKDLVSTAYDEQLDALQKIIDKKKESLDADADLYEYERTIAEKTKAVTDKQKQLNALSGDNSEENQAIIQQIKVELQDAQDDLEQTEYEKYREDEEKMLDALYEQYETLLNERLDNFDFEFEEVIAQVNISAGEISNTLTSVASEQGYNITDAIQNIWKDENPVSVYGNLLSSNLSNVTTAVSGTTQAVNDIYNFIKSMKAEADRKAAEEEAARIAAEEAARKASEEAARVAAEEAARQSSTVVSNNSGGGQSYSPPSSGVSWIHSPDYYPKNQLNINTSIVDRLKYHDFASDWNARSQYYSQMGGGGEYYATYDQNVWMLEKMKEMGYAKGTKKLESKDGYAWTNEGLSEGKGGELIRTSDGALLTPVGNNGTVFSNDMSNTLWDFASSPDSFINGLIQGATTPSVASNTSVQSSYTIGDVSLSFPNVMNYEDFVNRFKNDSNMEKYLSSSILGQLTNGNSLTKNRYK